VATSRASKPNIVVIWGDDIGTTNLSCYSDGLMGYRTPDIDRIAQEGMRFTDCYGEQSCTAGRASFITGQHGLRTGLTKVGLPAATVGLSKEDPTIAALLKSLGYATAQFGKNHLGDRNEYLPTAHGFDEFYGNLYHLNAEKSRSCPITRKHRISRIFARGLGLAACWIARRPTPTIRQSTPASVRSANRPSTTPAR
jgi:arylsulfatase